MISQVIFKIDKKLKDQAMKKAQKDGLPFASVLKFATKAFVDGHLEVGFVESLNPKTRRELSKISKDFAAGKNILKFKSVEEMKSYLKK